MPYFADITASGPVMHRLFPDDVGVLEAPGRPIPVGIASEVGHDERGRALWRLRIAGSLIPGLWFIVDRTFLAADADSSWPPIDSTHSISGDDGPDHEPISPQNGRFYSQSRPDSPEEHLTACPDDVSPVAGAPMGLQFRLGQPQEMRRDLPGEFIDAGLSGRDAAPGAGD
jgi:hypothetical protein